MNWYDLDPEEVKRRLSALERLSHSAKSATTALSRFGVAADSSEEWPEVVLEDILDAEYIEE